jgi:hypothetical protein
MCDEPYRTIAITTSGEMDFQTYFVKEKWQPELIGLRWEGATHAKMTAQVNHLFTEKETGYRDQSDYWWKGDKRSSSKNVSGINGSRSFCIQCRSLLSNKILIEWICD